MTLTNPDRRFGPAGKLRPILAAALLCLCGILAAVDASAAAKRVSENSGTVCFERGARPGGPEINGTLVTFRPHFGCLSSSCTTIVDSQFTIETEKGLIDMTSLFSIQGPKRPRICTTDCMGGGREVRDVMTIVDGANRVVLGGVELGILDTAELNAKEYSRICFSTPHPFAAENIIKNPKK